MPFGPGPVHRRTAPRHAGATGRPLRPALDPRDQPNARGQLARTDRRSNPGRCHPRPPGAQRLPDQPQGRVDEKAGEEIDGAGRLRLTMQPLRRCAPTACPNDRGTGVRISVG
ncbi:Exonuclease SbcC [Ectopseudomonas oleovorans]|uniref:Uncharacterized protein n=1 Tax=Ectopseudomonas oleovorans TaxID=301 RepID=A0A653BCZ3_ECTOL|nr:Exonuclease SbcC [Pseudomonas oleovorans]